MSEEQSGSIKVRVDGRAYPVAFAGARNSGELVVGPVVDGVPVNFRHPPVKGSDVPADFYTPAIRLATICSDIARTEGIERLKALVAFVDSVPENDLEQVSLVSRFPEYDRGLTFNLTCYMQAWRKVGGSGSAIIFREDLEDIVETIEEVYQSKALEKVPGR